MEQSNKVFCGSGKYYGNFGAVGVSICIDEIPSEYITTSKNGKRYVKINVVPKKNPDDKGTHYVEVNTWKPTNQGGQVANSFGQPSISQSELSAGIKNMFADASEEVPF